MKLFKYYENITSAMESDTPSPLLFATHFLLALPIMSALVTAIGFFLTISIHPAHFIIAILLSAIFSQFLVKLPLKETLKTLTVSTVLVVAMVLFVTPFYDFARDAKGFHNPAIITLAQGWNPVYQNDVQEFTQAKSKRDHEFNYAHVSDDALGQHMAGAVAANFSTEQELPTTPMGSWFSSPFSSPSWD